MRKNAIVSGTSFEGREKIVRTYCKEGVNVILKREPNNTHDKNAIAVYIETPVFFGLLGRSKKQIGYVKANTAVSLAKKMDAGEKFTASVVSFYAPEEREYPRVTIEISDEI